MKHFLKNSKKEMTTWMLSFSAFLLSVQGFGQIVSSLDTTFKSNDFEIRIFTKRVSEEWSVLSSTVQGKTDMIDSMEFSTLGSLQIIDFDKDRNPDILSMYLGNNPIYELYLFNPEKKKYIKIQNYSWFPNSKPVDGQVNLYYSYHRAGCADMNWISDLWIFENFNIIHLGRLYGQGCDVEFDKYPQQIEISKVLNNNENLLQLEALPYMKSISSYGTKVEFIRNYWGNNYRKFTRE